MPIGQGERWYYGDESARENPEGAVRSGEPGAFLDAAARQALEAYSLAIAAAIVQTADYAESNGIPLRGARMIAQKDAPAWSAAPTYNVGDRVILNNIIYRCVLQHANHEPPNLTYWQQAVPFLVGPAGMQIGSFLLDELASAALSALARSTSGADRVWYRGNNDPALNGGAPLLIDQCWARNVAYKVGARVAGDPVAAGTYPMDTARDGGGNAAQRIYKCTAAGTSANSGAGPTGTGTGVTDGGCTWDYVEPIATAERLTVAHAWTTKAVGATGYTGNNPTYQIDFSLQTRGHDNLDGLRYMSISFYKSDGSVAARAPFYATVPDRLYKVPGTDADTGNVTKFSVQISFSADDYPANYFNGYLRVRLYNAQGGSAQRDFDFVTPADGTSIAGEFTLNGAAPGGGDGGGGGGDCVAPETPVRVAPDKFMPIMFLRPGDKVWTVPEHGGPADYYPVAKVRQSSNLRCEVCFTDGRRCICSVNHLINVRGVWRRADSLQPGEEVQGEPSGFVREVVYLGEGPVVKVLIEGAHTYFAGDGAWHHNINKL